MQTYMNSILPDVSFGQALAYRLAVSFGRVITLSPTVDTCKWIMEAFKAERKTNK